ncbi:MAG: YihY/virulence factor BrkB family protein [Bacteroidota bacterium]
MKKKITNIGSLLKKALVNWFNRDPFRESAIIAYNAIFSLPGLLVVVLTLSGYVFGADAVSGRLHNQIAKAMGSDTADQVQEMILMAHRSKDSVLATILGIVIIIIGATGVFVELQRSLNSIWQVKGKIAKSGIKAFITTRLFSFGLIISIAFMLLISLVITSLVAAIGNWMQQHWSESFIVLFHVINFLVSLSIITILFALMFKILPDAKIKWGSVWLGAFLTSLLFILGKFILGLYFGKAQPGSGYGAAGSVILILLWTSYSSLIVFFGAEFTKVYSDHYYGVAAPSENAVKNMSLVK